MHCCIMHIPVQWKGCSPTTPEEPMDRAQIARHATQQHTGPVVWILSKGEFGEGGEVIAVFADRDLARGQFTHEATNMAFAIDDARQNEDGSIHLEAGCDWLALEPHQLITHQQLA
jgi:hypothetical protein